MRSFIAIAAIFAAVNADGHEKEDWNMDDWNKDMDDWNKDMDHGKDHHMDHDMKHEDWKEMECMMTGVCDSAISLGASAAALAATMAILM